MAVARTVLAGAARYEWRGEQDLARDATRVAIDALRIAFYEAQDELQPNQFWSPQREELLQVNERWKAIIEQGHARRKDD